MIDNLEQTENDVNKIEDVELSSVFITNNESKDSVSEDPFDFIENEYSPTKASYRKEKITHHV
jgi:hypothetical protein